METALTLLVAHVLVAAMPVESGLEPERLGIRVTEAVTGDWSPLVIAALRARTAGLSIDVLGDEVVSGEPSAPWQVRLEPAGSERLQVQIVRPEGTPLGAATLRLKGSGREVTAQTIALFVLETMAPVVPALAQLSPPAPTNVNDAAALEAMPAPEAESTLRLVLAAGAGAAWITATDEVHPSVSLNAAARLAGNPFELRFTMEALSPREVRAEDVRLGVLHGAARALVGAGWPLGPTELWAGVGPALRAFRFTARGEGVRFEATQRGVFAVAAEVGVSGQWEPLIWQLCASWTQDVGRHPRLVVDGRRSYDVGYGQLGAELRFGTRM